MIIVRIPIFRDHLRRVIFVFYNDFLALFLVNHAFIRRIGRNAAVACRIRRDSRRRNFLIGSEIFKGSRLSVRVADFQSIPRTVAHRRQRIAIGALPVMKFRFAAVGIADFRQAAERIIGIRKYLSVGKRDFIKTAKRIVRKRRPMSRRIADFTDFSVARAFFEKNIVPVAIDYFIKFVISEIESGFFVVLDSQFPVRFKAAQLFPLFVEILGGVNYVRDVSRSVVYRLPFFAFRKDDFVPVLIDIQKAYRVRIAVRSGIDFK